MAAPHYIRVANDNGPSRAHRVARRPVRRSPAAGSRHRGHAPATPQTKPRKGARAAARLTVLYHLVLLAGGCAAIATAQTFGLVGGLFALAALGGLGAVLVTERARPILRGGLSASTAVSAVVAGLLLLPVSGMLGGVPPLVIATAIIAAVALATTSRALAFAGLGLLALVIADGALISLTPVAIGALTGAVLAVAVTGYRSGSKAVPTVATGLALFALGQTALEMGIGPARILLAFMLLGTGIVAFGAAARRSGLITGLGVCILIASAFALQLGLRDGGGMDALWYAGAVPHSVLLGVGLVQAVVLVSGIVALVRGRLNVVGLFGLQALAAAFAYTLLRPDMVGGLIAPWGMGEDSRAALLLLGGTAMGGLVFALARAWHRDRPVATGAYALGAILQAMLLAPLALPDPASALPALLAGSTAIAVLWLALRKRG